MTRTVAAVVAVACVLAVALHAPATGNADEIQPIGRPNVIVFYLDDTNPNDGRLWGDPTLTPNLYDLFVAHGINVENAFGETPLCCPSRATLLTGLHTHNHGVIYNDARLFNPAENVGKEMAAAGYESMLIGKYMNQPDLLTPEQWQAAAAGWSQFDVFSTSSTASAYKYFYDYSMFTKQGPLSFGEAPEDHSTRVIADRAVMRMQQALPFQPLFQILSIFNTHDPNIPMPGLENDPRWAQCASMPPWDPPNYNEADVSDKPLYVRNSALQPYPDGWPMVNYCREMLGVDWLVGQVTDELKAEGRFNNTVFMFSADNGMNWGQHRLGQDKEAPYATRVPLYFSWPARWGNSPRTVDEYVSDIDFAPTICAISGCTLGPYPGGQTKPDGVSLLPLLDGTVDNLGRDALLEDSFDKRIWAAVRTTPESPLGLWHYVLNGSGFAELYNNATDPWELDNVAGDPDNADLLATLRVRLFQLLAEGRPNNPATLTVIEDSVPNGGQDFAYGGDLGSFSLDDDANRALPRKKVLTNLVPGSYTIIQAEPPGWTLSSISCPTGVGTTVDTSTGTASVQLQPNDNVTCTFTNLRRRPDTSIALADFGPFKGDNIYSATAIKKETQRRDLVAAGQEYDYFVIIQNDGKAADTFTIKADVIGAASMAVSFEAGGADITADVSAGTYTTGALAPAASTVVLVRVAVAPDAAVSDMSTVTLRAASVAAPAAVDVVRAVTVH